LRPLPGYSAIDLRSPTILKSSVFFIKITFARISIEQNQSKNFGPINMNSIKNNFLNPKFGVAVVALWLLSSCSAVEQASQLKDKAGDIQKTAEQAQGAIAKLAASKDGLFKMKEGVSQTLAAVKSGDFTKAQQDFGTVQETWKGLEAGLKTVSADGTQKVQGGLETVATELKAEKPDANKLTTGLQGLATSIGSLAVGGAELPPAGTIGATGDKSGTFQTNLVAMKEALSQATSAVESSDFTAAKDSFSTARQTWFKFGGSVKQQSDETYQKMDQSVKTVNSAMTTGTPQKDALLVDLKALAGDLDSLSAEKK
jgi:hypothetical protein